MLLSVAYRNKIETRPLSKQNFKKVCDLLVKRNNNAILKRPAVALEMKLNKVAGALSIASYLLLQ